VGHLFYLEKLRLRLFYQERGWAGGLGTLSRQDRLYTRFNLA